MPEFSTQLTLLWVAPLATATSYVVEAGSSPGAADLAQLDTGDTRPVLEVEAPAGLYYVRVRSNVGGILSLPSNEIRLTVGSIPVPGPPSGLSASTTGSTVSFSWTPPSSGAFLTSYVLVAGLTPAFSVPYMTVPLGPTPRFVVSSVPPGTYYVRVLAQNASGTSAPSNETTVTIGGAPAPGAPVLNTPVVNGNTVRLSWSAGSGGAPTGYSLSASVTPGGAPIRTVPLTGTAISFSDVPAGTYYLRLTATTATGTSPPSAQVTLTVP